MFWPTFQTARGLQVIVIEAGHLAMARIKAAMLGQKGEFQEGHRLDRTTAKKVPHDMIARTLSHKEAFALLKRIT